jgi:hypothetical protein
LPQENALALGTLVTVPNKAASATAASVARVRRDAIGKLVIVFMSEFLHLDFEYRGFASGIPLAQTNEPSDRRKQIPLRYSGIGAPYGFTRSLTLAATLPARWATSIIR